MRLKNGSPDSGHGQWIVFGWKKRVRGFDHHQGDGRRVAQIDGQFQMRTAEEGMLAGKASDPAGKVGIQRQVVVPELLVSELWYAIEAMPAAAVQGGTER